MDIEVADEMMNAMLSVPRNFTGQFSSPVSLSHCDTSLVTISRFGLFDPVQRDSGSKYRLMSQVYLITLTLDINQIFMFDEPKI